MLHPTWFFFPATAVSGQPANFLGPYGYNALIGGEQFYVYYQSSTSGTPTGNNQYDCGSVGYCVIGGGGLIANGDADNRFSLANVSYSLSPVSATPLPAALPLFATGLGVMGLLGWRRKRKGVAPTAA